VWFAGIEDPLELVGTEVWVGFTVVDMIDSGRANLREQSKLAQAQLLFGLEWVRCGSDLVF
jgi:hypothetical protein